jgi:hypothetical protein
VAAGWYQTLKFTLSHIYNTRFEFDCSAWDASLPDTVTFYIGPVMMTPIPKNQTGAAVWSLDDVHSSWAIIESILNQYGYHGNYNVSPAKPDLADDETYEADGLPVIRAIKSGGGEIASHGYYHNITKQSLFDELCKSKEVLQRDGLGEIDFMALPGGTSAYTGDVIAKCHRGYRGVRFWNVPLNATEGEIAPFFSTTIVASVGDLAMTLDQVKENIMGAIRNHEVSALYAHRIGTELPDLDTTRVTQLCAFLFDLGIPALTYSQAFPVNAYPNKPNYVRTKKAHVKGKETKVYRTAACAAASTTAVHAAIDLTGAAQKITTGITSPDVYRCVSITGNAALEAGNVLVEGTNWAGNIRQILSL